MATAAQISANQLNAQSSTGPRTAEGKTAASQNASKHGFTGSDETVLRQNAEVVESLAAIYALQFPSTAPTAYHLYYLLACASIRQRALEAKQMDLLYSVELDDPILARVERYRAAAERSFYKALKELQALVRNEPISDPAPAVTAAPAPKLPAPAAIHSPVCPPATEKSQRNEPAHVSL